MSVVRNGIPWLDQRRGDRGRRRAPPSSSGDAASGPGADRRRPVEPVDRGRVAAPGAEPVAQPDPDPEGNHGSGDVQCRSGRLLPDGQDAGPDAEEQAGQDEPDRGRVGDAHPTPGDRRPDEDRSRRRTRRRAHRPRGRPGRSRCAIRSRRVERPGCLAHGVRRTAGREGRRHVAVRQRAEQRERSRRRQAIAEHDRGRDRRGDARAC